MRLFRFFLPLALILACLMAADSGRGSYQTKGLNAVASWLAQREVVVSCLTEQESKDDVVIGIFGAEAYVNGWRDSDFRWHPWDVAFFKFGYCERLTALLRGRAARYTVAELAGAILVLTHESGHLRGHRWSADEAKTECWAIRHFKYVAARFGVEPGSYEMALFYGHALAFHESMPAQYHGGCVIPPA